MFDYHQFMLSARSPVFKAMFLADMAEKRIKKVNVKDFHPDVLSELLTFIYSGKTSKMDKFAKDLLASADKYQLDQLKSACAEHLCSNIDFENCISHLIWETCIKQTI